MKAAAPGALATRRASNVTWRTSVADVFERRTTDFRGISQQAVVHLEVKDVLLWPLTLRRLHYITKEHWAGFLSDEVIPWLHYVCTRTHSHKRTHSLSFIIYTNTHSDTHTNTHRHTSRQSCSPGGVPVEDAPTLSVGPRHGNDLSHVAAAPRGRRTQKRTHTHVVFSCHAVCVCSL